jgi:hypothetical protein
LEKKVRKQACHNMAEQPDYYIYKVHYSNKHKHIETVLTTTNLSRTDIEEKKREEVVKDINIYDKLVLTAPPDSIGLKNGAKVITERLRGNDYIKTVPDGKEEDNLDVLPEY